MTHNPRRDGYVPLPIERALAWSGVSFFARSVGTEVFRLYQEREIQVGKDWRVALCRALEVDGRERGNVCRALDALVEAGLIVVGDGFVRLLYTDDTLAEHRRSAAPAQPLDEASGDDPETVDPTSIDTPQDVDSASGDPPQDIDSTSGAHPPDIHPDSSARNHSGPNSQEIRDKREERTVRARARDLYPPGCSIRRLGGCWDGRGGETLSLSSLELLDASSDMIDELATERGSTDPVAWFSSVVQRFRFHGKQRGKQLGLHLLLQDLLDWADPPGSSSGSPPPADELELKRARARLQNDVENLEQAVSEGAPLQSELDSAKRRLAEMG